MEAGLPAGPTFLAQQEGVEAEVVDGQVEPALPRHATFPVAARVIVDQLLLFGHPKQLAHLQLGFLELAAILLLPVAQRRPLLLGDQTLRSQLIHVRQRAAMLGWSERRRRTEILPLTKVATSESLSKAATVCSRLASSQSQCSVISLREEPTRRGPAPPGQTPAGFNPNPIRARGLTAGHVPEDLRVGRLEEDPVGGHPGTGVQNHIQSPHQQTCTQQASQIVTQQRSLFFGGS